jgi:thymidine kinase
LIELTDGEGEYYAIGTKAYIVKSEIDPYDSNCRIFYIDEMEFKEKNNKLQNDNDYQKRDFIIVGLYPSFEKNEPSIPYNFKILEIIEPIDEE